MNHAEQLEVFKRRLESLIISSGQEWNLNGYAVAQVLFARGFLIVSQLNALNTTPDKIVPPDNPPCQPPPAGA